MPTLKFPCRPFLTIAAALWLLPAPVAADTGDAESHPLRIHMSQWLQGSGQWRSPNPDYDPSYSGQPALASIRQFGINWTWDPVLEYLSGEIIAILDDRTELPSSAMFAFYNPVTERVTFNQIGRNGSFTSAEDPVRRERLEFGEVERFDAVEYLPNGQVKLTRHENVFHGDGTHTSTVLERDESGRWQPVAKWTWTLMREAP